MDEKGPYNSDKIPSASAGQRELHMLNSQAKITTISFDGDGTLWDFEKVMRLSLGHALAELRHLVPDVPETLTIETMITLRNQVSEELRGKVATWRRSGSLLSKGHFFTLA